MFVNSFISFDHETKKMKIVALCSLDGDIEHNYSLALERIQSLEKRLSQPVVHYNDPDPQR